MPPVLASLLGIVAILAFAFLLSNAKRKIRLRVVVSAFALQALLAFLILRTSGGRMVIREMSAGVAALLSYADAGTAFLFGADNPLQNTFALGALPVIVFFAALVSILYHLGIMQVIVRWLGGAIGFLTGISKVEALGSAANIFVGQSESPLVVRPYLAALAPSRLFTLMTVGMAGVAGTILAAYAGLLGNEYLPFLLAAAFMSAPGGILMAKIIMPDVDEASPEAEGELSLPRGRISAEGPAAITERRETTQPIREKTGGSTFKNPEGRSSWKLVDDAGWRGKPFGGAKFSELHSNFMINFADATAADIEGLGEAVRADVKDKFGVDLQWEIRRIGRPA